MNDLVIYGAGGFGRETVLLIDQLNAADKQWNLKGFYDDGIEKGKRVDELEILGGLKEVNAIEHTIAMVVAIADPVIRKRIAGNIHNHNIKFPVLIHPDANKGSRFNVFEQGCIITAGCILTTGIRLNEFTVVNLNTTIGHDVKTGPFSTIMPGCNISGNVQLGACTLIGTGAQILQNLSIGKNCKVGAGAVVTKDYGDNLVLIGIPARKA
jgi:sugar O-acyltransferase (sialic acid O-acetyltransferase NeuD family)